MRRTRHGWLQRWRGRRRRGEPRSTPSPVMWLRWSASLAQPPVKYARAYRPILCVPLARNAANSTSALTHVYLTLIADANPSVVPQPSGVRICRADRTAAARTSPADYWRRHPRIDACAMHICRVSDVDAELDDLEYNRSRLQLDKEETARKTARAR